jgi:GcrA cell cycle regulator
VNPLEIPAGWTDERVEALKRLWADGLSVSKIAAAIGGGLSRNAVIGKVHRLGLSGRKEKVSCRATPARNSASRRRTKSWPPPSRTTAGTRTASRPVLFYAEVLAATQACHPEPIKLKFDALGMRNCRYPFGHPGTPDFFFCGIPEADFPEQPYCSFHRRWCGGGYGNRPQRAYWRKKT